MPSARLLFSLLLPLALLSGCREAGEPSEVVAQVYDYTLCKDDLKGLVGEGLTEDDSVAIVSNYIDQWIRQTVMLAKAEKNVTADFSKQMREYRNSLFTYAYEQQIVGQLLDTNVSEEEIENYYEQHREEFPLKNSIVKVVYVIGPRKLPASYKFRALVGRQKFGDAEIVELERMASHYKLQGYYESDVWMPFFSLQERVPITTYNEDLFLKHHRSAVITDDSLTYYVRFLDYKVSDEVSPLELQRDNVKSIILNHRKIEILSKLQSDLMKEAEEGGYVKRNQ
mgnify:CR=1 FL=1